MANAVQRQIQMEVELSSAVVVRPGDTLIIGFRQAISPENLATIRQRLRERLPGIEAAIIDQCTGLAVYRPEQAADGTQPGQAGA